MARMDGGEVDTRPALPAGRHEIVGDRLKYHVLDSTGRTLDLGPIDDVARVALVHALALDTERTRHRPLRTVGSTEQGAAEALAEAVELRRENVELHRECVALSERAVADHDKYGRNLVTACLAGLGIGYPVGFILCAWLGIESGALALGCYGLLAVQLGLSWYWRRTP